MESKYIFGIDLGTTYSVISYLDDNVLIQSCKNDESSDITPSVVDYSDTEPVVGQLAKDNKVLYPHSVLDFFKRQMGNGHGVIFYGEDFDKQTTPIQLSTEVLKYLARYASNATGSRVSVVVITVPAYFGTKEKQATKEAAEQAGFEKVHLIEEPTAAAVYYGYKGDKNETVLVYDLGGGTFDVVAVKINGYNYNCFVVDGDQQLGGKDWDDELRKILISKLSDMGLDATDFSDDDNAELHDKAEKAKIALTKFSSTNVILRLGTGKKNIEITRNEFEKATKYLLDRTIETTRRVKEQAEAKGSKISKILLVGGSSYMPQVQERLIVEFPDLEVPNPMDPNMAVSKGAAYYGKKILEEILKKSNESSEAGVSGGTSNPNEFSLSQGLTKGEQEIVENLPPNFALPGGIIKIQKVSASSIGVEGEANGKPTIFTLLKRGDVLPVTTDIDIPLSDQAIAAGSVNLSLYEHRLEDMYVDKGNSDAQLKELEAQTGAISTGLPSGAKMSIHMEIDKEGLLRLTATDPNGVAISLEATAEAKSSE